MDEALALRAIRSVLLVTLPTEYAWSWDFGSWERGPEGVGESRFGDISQTPPWGGQGSYYMAGPKHPVWRVHGGRSRCDLGSLRWDLV